ncbi:MAG: type I methionyl aminopeptidase [Deltaproteobacteria bacterium]|nr:type I methionyl aminopeptidase [Deltaproteobacteria bacterium]
MIKLKSPQEIQIMRDAGRIVAEILALLSERAVPGVSTRDLDELAEHECGKRKVKAAFKGYAGFPYTICASPNEKVVHGFSDSTPLKEGDILSIDFGVEYRGFFGDAAVTVPIGKVDKGKQALMNATREALERGINLARPGNRLSDISHAVQSFVEKKGFSVVRKFVGHGIGRALHEAPQIPNFGPPGKGVLLEAGMTLAIEPMINSGSEEVRILSDGWTAVTADKKPSAHFEHTIAVTEDGPVILTAT